GSEVLETKDWGKRRLAYEIEDFTDGYYNIVRIQSDNNKATDEFQRLAKINDDIIRYIVVREDENK
ncbi:30S ribosomal protein S6, partial [Staphylococcus felis]